MTSSKSRLNNLQLPRIGALTNSIDIKSANYIQNDVVFDQSNGHFLDISWKEKNKTKHVSLYKISRMPVTEFEGRITPNMSKNLCCMTIQVLRLWPVSSIQCIDFILSPIKMSNLSPTLLYVCVCVWCDLTSCEC